MNEKSLVEQLEGLKYHNCDIANCKAYFAGVEDSIAIVRQHQALPSETAVEAIKALEHASYCYGFAQASGVSQERLDALLQTADNCLKSAIAVIRNNAGVVGTSGFDSQSPNLRGKVVDAGSTPAPAPAKHNEKAAEDIFGSGATQFRPLPPAGSLLDPEMPAQELRLHLGEMTAQEERSARAAIRWANSARKPVFDEHLTTRLVMALMRVTDRFRLSVQQKPVRDMAETLGEVEAAIKAASMAVGVVYAG